MDLDHQGEPAAAWEALARGRRLEPGAHVIEALDLWLLPAPSTPPRRDDGSTRTGRGSTSPPELCLGCAFAELALSEGALDARERLDHAREIAALGQSRMVLGGRISSAAQSVGGASLVLSLHLAAIAQIARERLAGHSPGLDLLYRVGLGRFAADAHARGLEDPVDVLRGGTPRALEGPHPIAPIAA